MASADQNINFMMQFASAGIKSVDEFLKIMEQMLAEHQDDRYAKEILDFVKEKGQEALNFTTCKDMVAKDFEQELKKRDIPYYIMRNNRTGEPVFVSRNCDTELVKEAKEATYVRTRTINEVSFDTLAKNNISSLTKDYKPLSRIRDVSKDQLSLIKEEAAKSRVIFAKKENEQGKYDIYFYPADDRKFSEIYMNTNFQLHGEFGEFTKNRLANERKTNEYIMDYFNRHFNREDFYIVAGNNPDNLIRISNSKMEHVLAKEGEERDVCLRYASGTLSEVQKTVYLEMKNMKNPVVLTATEYDMNKEDKENLLRVIKDKKKEQNQNVGVEYLQKEQKEIAEKQRLALRLVEDKLLMENFPITEFEFSVFDENFSFHEFVNLNLENLEDIGEKQEKIDQMQDIADILDNSSPEVKSRIYSYLGDNATLIENYASLDDIEIYQPTYDDMTHNIDDFIANMDFDAQHLEKQELTARDNNIIDTDERDI